MANHQSHLFCFISSIFVLALALSLSCGATNEEREVYIVYMGSLPEGAEYSPSSQHVNILQQVIGSGSIASSLVRSYKRSFNGFAAKLTKDEKQKIASMNGVVSVFPNRVLKLQTTRSWDFMGFNESIRRNDKVESDIVVGVIDSGVWPDSDSFKDDGFGPPPQKWKGSCKGGENFTCNNKVVGARFYISSSAIDDEGHGSHTASTAAGNKVPGASFYGIAKGTARGAVPSSRIAVYKVCSADGCQSTDILAAFDDAIADGVDVITISIGGSSPPDFDQDTIAIGAFHAMAKGILTMHSAGNTGPAKGSIVSVAPWIFSVGASSIDRQIVDKVVLGNGKKIVGKTGKSFTLNGTKFPLIHGKQASSSCSVESARACRELCLDESLVKGKIVLCNEFEGIGEAYRAGAIGTIALASRPDVAFILPLPALALNSSDYSAVESYISSSKKPEANILKSEEIKDPAAPIVASFSARGPNLIALDIMKPDVTAPGIEVLAAYSPVNSPSISESDTRRVKYSVLAGTSMSCPHVAGVAAYVKSFHPDWSPSAIKSAIMTTAWQMNRIKNENAEFDYGSGYINPVEAINPGLVYDAGKEDYIKMLCGAGYSDGAIKLISGDNSTCKRGSSKTSPKDLNYPSMTASVSPNKAFRITFNRTVTNVGFANSTYKAKVSSSVSEFSVEVAPQVLSFKSLKEKKTFVVSIAGRGLEVYSMMSASLTWSDGTHSVRSPIIAYAMVPLKSSFD